MKYCDLERDGDLQRCRVCGNVFRTTDKIRAVCGVDREPRKPSSGGTGTELKKLLALFGIKSSPTCACNAKAAYLDHAGDDWCEENVETIVEWLKEEAARRGLPFFSTAGRMLVKRAIANSRRAGAIGSSHK